MHVESVTGNGDRIAVPIKVESRKNSPLKISVHSHPSWREVVSRKLSGTAKTTVRESTMAPKYQGRCDERLRGSSDRVPSSSSSFDDSDIIIMTELPQEVSNNSITVKLMETVVDNEPLSKCRIRLYGANCFSAHY
jgi:hypothetical protein